MAKIHLNAGAVELVPLSESHIQPILDLMNKEGWYYYDSNELGRYLRLNQDCFTMVKKGHVIGSLFTTNFGRQAWIGNIVVAEQERRKGLATETLKTVMRHLRDTKRVEEFRLGAVPLAVGLYRRLGFSAEAFTSAREAALPIALPTGGTELDGRVQMPLITREDLHDISKLDARYFKSDRLFLLRELYRDSIRQACLCLKEADVIGGFIMIRRRQASKTEAGLIAGPEYTYRIGPSCILPKYGIHGFSALLHKALLAINEEVAHLDGSAKIYVVFPKNADATSAKTSSEKQGLADRDDDHATVLAATGSAKNESQAQLMTGLGFHQEYFEQVMVHSTSKHTKETRRGLDADDSRPDPEGVFASATPGDKA
jgi:GNAT superfamily N-acetyltransferase